MRALRKATKISKQKQAPLSVLRIILQGKEGMSYFLVPKIRKSLVNTSGKYKL